MLLAQEPHPEPTAGFPALLVLVIAILIFHGSVYLLVALNTGWRLGYWITGSVMGGLALFLSLFWMTNTLGPRGQEPRFFPLAAAEGTIGDTTFNKTTFRTPSRYPGPPWEAVKGERDPMKAEADALSAAISNCLTFDPNNEEKMRELEREIEKQKGLTRIVLEGRFGIVGRMERELETCKQATSMLPPEDSIPVIEGVRVTVVPDVTDIRFTREGGTLLGQATVVPNTYDKRLTGDPEGRKPLAVGRPFRILAYKDPGSLRYPATVYLVLSLLWLGFHLWGLNRMERRKLSALVT